MDSKVSNPLTIVAIFAGLAEAFATIALIYVPHDIQQVFVFFVMAFPTLIVLIFFSVLNWNHTVLYAPGDFKDESMYLESIRLLKSEVISTLIMPSDESPPLTKQQIKSTTEKIEDTFSKALDEKLGLIGGQREQRLLDLLNDGPASAAEIAQATNLSEMTVRSYFRILMNSGKIKINDQKKFELITHVA